jgi:hypothetical protein
MNRQMGQLINSLCQLETSNAVDLARTVARRRKKNHGTKLCTAWLIASIFGCNGNAARTGAAAPGTQNGASSSARSNAGAPAGSAGMQSVASGVAGSAAVGGMTNPPLAGMVPAVAGSSAPSVATPSAGSAGLASTAGSAGLGATPTAGAAGVAGHGDSVAGAGNSGQVAAGSAGQAVPNAVLDGHQTLLPDKSWTCGMPDGIPGPLSGQPVFDIDMQVSDVHDLGQTQYGHRHQIDIKGGTVEGDKLHAVLMDRGLDYQLTLANGAVEVEQLNILQADSSAVYMRNCGVSPGPGSDVRMVLDFEAPNGGTLAWLNTGTFVATREFDPAKQTLRLKVYEVKGAADAQNAVRVVEPADAPDQSWECSKAAGAQGSAVYMETVAIDAGSVAVGDSKRGTRNIIPITGGTTTGKITGSVLSGGADFQLLSGATLGLDARYTLKTNDGELIIVRNCGTFGAFVPTFEARLDGKYAWLNANDWLSSDPAIGLGTVSLTVYDKR